MACVKGMKCHYTEHYPETVIAHSEKLLQNKNNGLLSDIGK